MRLSYFKRTALSVVAAVSLFSVTALAAPVYKDVPGTHWAHSFISAVADRGLMLGDTSANFRPDDLIDKFETSKILARSSGYKYENISASEQDYYNKCYDKNKSFLAQYGAKFTKWNNSADREISFLLEKEILTAADLNQFVVVTDSGVEQLRALSRGEAAVFITKLMGKNSEASSVNVSANPFKDDAKIQSAVKPYVYYLRGAGIVSGDTDGNFNANGAVTRATMAVMLARALNLTGASAAPGTGVTAPSTTTNTAVSAITTVSGTMDIYYANLNAVQITSGTGDKRIYRLASNVTVYIDGYLKTSTDLRAGMLFNGVLNNDEFINIQAQSQTTSPQDISYNDDGMQYSAIDGTVSTIDQSGAVRTIDIEIKTLNPRDSSIITDVRAFALASGCKITRGGGEIQFSEILRGDIVSAKVSGSTVYEMEFEERVVILKDATLEEKRYNEQSGQVTLVVKDAKDRSYELRLAANTTISRKSVGSTTWDQLRVGDLLDLTAEYGIIKDLVAYGVISTADGWIDSINIGSYQSYVMLRDSYGMVKKYYVISDSTDIYSLRVGNKMRVRLDSQEISTFMLLEEVSTNVVTGYVSSVRSGVFVLTNTQPYGSNGKRNIQIDSSTLFVNSETGEKVAYSAMREGQRVYVVFKNTSSDIAKTITILAD